MRWLIIGLAVAAWVGMSGVAGAAFADIAQPEIDTSGENAARSAIQTLIDDRSPSAPVTEAAMVKEELVVPAAPVDDVMPTPTLKSAPTALAGAAKADATAVPASTYQFDECQRPIRPDFDKRPIVSSSAARQLINRDVNQYNAFVEEANAYMSCIADQARRDLDTHYQTVSGGLEDEQGSIMSEVETVRTELNKRR